MQAEVQRTRLRLFELAMRDAAIEWQILVRAIRLDVVPDVREMMRRRRVIVFHVRHVDVDDAVE